MRRKAEPLLVRLADFGGRLFSICDAAPRNKVPHLLITPPCAAFRQSTSASGTRFGTMRSMLSGMEAASILRASQVTDLRGVFMRGTAFGGFNE